MYQSIIITEDIETCDHILAQTILNSVVVKYASSILRRIVYWRLCLYTAETKTLYNKYLCLKLLLKKAVADLDI